MAAKQEEAQHRVDEIEALKQKQIERLEEVAALTREEARAILYLARRRGAMEVKGVNHAFDSSERFLAVCVELDLERTFILKRRDDPQLTIRFLDGFRQLCVSGLVMHHLLRDFSLTRRGFEVARSIRREDVPVLVPLADEQLIEIKQGLG